MLTSLTPGALSELSDLLRTSRRRLAEVYRDHSHGLTAEEIAESKGHDDPRRILECLSALRIIFGRQALPKRGDGRQMAISEADHWLNADVILSPELQDHLNKILVLGKRTNQRNKRVYTPPEPVLESIKPRKRRPNGADGRQAGIYVLTRHEFWKDFENGGPLLIKIGYSETVWERIQSAQTWDPEPVKLLRVYLVDNPKIIETKFHVVLDTLGQRHNAGGGIEWFSTNLELIDSIASTLNLRDCSGDQEGTDTIELWENQATS